MQRGVSVLFTLKTAPDLESFQALNDPRLAKNILFPLTPVRASAQPSEQVHFEKKLTQSRSPFKVDLLYI